MDDLAEELISGERAALDRWIRGDTQGFADLCDPEVTFFDSSLPRRIDGIAAVSRLLAKMAGGETIDMRLALSVFVITSSAAGAAAQPASPVPSGSPAAHAAENDRYVAEVQRAIKGKEDLPAKEVFKNVTILGDVPAARVLRTMQSFTRALGVACTKCHVADDWASEDKDDKEVTRDMMKMTRAINEDYLKKIKALEDDKPSTSCFMCHRGQARPSAELRPGTPSR